MAAKRQLSTIFVAAIVAWSLGTVIFAVPPGANIALPSNSAGPDTVAKMLSSLGLSFTGALPSDSIFAMCLHGVIQPDSNYGGTDCWGWEDPSTHTEYAIMGVTTGIAFVNANTMHLVTVVPGPTSHCGAIRWRDIKTYQHYCYAVSECDSLHEGLMIMDMSFLPDSVHYIGSFVGASDTTSHNMNIDTVTGNAYLVKSNYSGVRIISLADPTAPVEIFDLPTGYCHDMFTHNDTMYVAEGYEGSFSIWNVTTKTNPVLLARVHIPDAGFVHNIWPTPDGQYVGTTEETPGRTIKFWDISNLADIRMVGQYLAESQLAHNVQIQGDKAFISHYQSGVVALGIADPSHPVELAAYDTYTQGESPDYAGCWGVFPHTRTGKVYGSNIDGRLFVFETHDGQVADTFSVSRAYGNAGTSVSLDIGLSNADTIQKLVIPVSWVGPMNLQFDSVSTHGLRTGYFQNQSYLSYQPESGRIVFQMVASYDESAPPLAPGSGPVLRLFFTIPPGTAHPINPVSLAPYAAQSTYYPAVFFGCFNLVAPAVEGGIILGNPGCCTGIRGNLVTPNPAPPALEDLAWLISYLTKPFGTVSISCPDEANVNANGLIDLVDTSLLIAYLTMPAGSVTLPNCP